ncbi:MAG: translation elongation factor Ts [Candidatus Moraniibacteriota bacterium]
MDIQQVKELRERTGAGVVEAKKVLDEAKGDIEKAIRLLRERGQIKAAKKSGREAKEGIVAQYLHSNRKVGAMVKLFCETDFVARNEDFKTLAYDIAMHITAMNPQYIRPEDVPDAIVAGEREIWVKELSEQKKPKAIMEKILEGKEKKFREEVALLSQPFVKNPDQTVGDMVTEHIAKIGENIQVGEFIRLSF